MLCSVQLSLPGWKSLSAREAQWDAAVCVGRWNSERKPSSQERPSPICTSCEAAPKNQVISNTEVSLQARKHRCIQNLCRCSWHFHVYFSRLMYSEFKKNNNPIFKNNYLLRVHSWMEYSKFEQLVGQKNTSNFSVENRENEGNII